MKVRMTSAGALGAALLLAACVAAPTKPAALKAPYSAPQSYTAETTYAKLARKYPFISVANGAVPASVRAFTGISYVRRGEHELQLDLYRPARQTISPLPAIVFVHGGGWNSGLRTNFAPMAVRMAERGYVAVTISYRLASEAQYPAAIHDVKAAVRWVRGHAADYGIDPTRIAIAGASAGGQLASLVGVTNGDRHFERDARPGSVTSNVQAIVNIDGLSDFTSETARKGDDDPAKQPSPAGAWLGARYADSPALWREASPIFHASANTPPILFIGSAQARFSVGRAEMIEKLNALGVPSQVVLLPDTPHSFWLFDPWLAPTVEATDAFLRAHLVSGSAG
jgi:pectinesterase